MSIIFILNFHFFAFELLFFVHNTFCKRIFVKILIYTYIITIKHFDSVMIRAFFNWVYSIASADKESRLCCVLYATRPKLHCYQNSGMTIGIYVCFLCILFVVLGLRELRWLQHPFGLITHTTCTKVRKVDKHI